MNSNSEIGGGGLIGGLQLQAALAGLFAITPLHTHCYRGCLIVGALPILLPSRGPGPGVVHSWASRRVLQPVRAHGQFPRSLGSSFGVAT